MAAAVSSGPTAATAIGTPAASSGGPAPPPQPPTEYLNEVPSSLKQLARIVVRGFYGVEDALIIDMLVRHPCMREDDVAGLLKFDKKMLRARMTSLKNDKFLQVKQRIETDEEGKVVKMNCYYINYRSFVNVVKYKLDHMRKRMETSERDQASRSLFKCMQCDKNFTDLEANQLIDFVTGEMRCTHCGGVVDEDEASGPQKDSRQLLAKFNSEMKSLYELLHIVENVNLAPDLLEPEPVDIDLLTGKKSKNQNKGPGGESGGDENGKWADRTGGFRDEGQQVKIAIGDAAEDDKKPKNRPKVPEWITNSAIDQTPDESQNQSSMPTPGLGGGIGGAADSEPMLFNEDSSKDIKSNAADDDDEITQILLRHERKAGGEGSKTAFPGDSDSDNKSDDSDMEDVSDAKLGTIGSGNPSGSDNLLSSMGPADDKMSSSDEEESGVPKVKVGIKEYPVTEIDAEVIAQMTPEEVEKYTQTYQEYYAHMYE